MRHLIVGTFLVLAALAVTSVTATLLERAAMNRRVAENPTAIVEGPNNASPNKAARPGELARAVIQVSRRFAAGLTE